jgi:D-sedoheptulose 7-phosphate isomerase
MSKDLNFLKNYYNIFKNNIYNEDIFKNLILVKKLIVKNKKNNLSIFGNGGSASIASHFAIDMTKNAKIKTMAFNDSSLITCLSNDYGYENWIGKTVDFYLKKNDIIILVSCSGESENLVNAIKIAKKKCLKKIITFTGCKKNNTLSKLSDISFWVNSSSYNIIENIHQFYLLSLVDMIIGKSEYKPN